MKRVYVMHEGKKYYWAFQNVFTSDINYSRLCSECAAKVFVSKTDGIYLIDWDAPVEVETEDLIIEDE